jgi:hypothetical protein
MSRTVTVAPVADLQMGYAASPRRDGKLALTDGITLRDKGGCGERRADPICAR